MQSDSDQGFFCFDDEPQMSLLEEEKTKNSDTIDFEHHTSFSRTGKKKKTVNCDQAPSN